MKASTIIATVASLGALGVIAHKLYYGRWPWDSLVSVPVTPTAPTTAVPQWFLSAYDPSRTYGESGYYNTPEEAVTEAYKFEQSAGPGSHVSVTGPDGGVIHQFQA